MLARYCIALDTLDLQMLKTVFSEDARLDYRPGLELGVGSAWFIEQARQALKPVKSTHHFLGTTLIEMTDPGAHVRTYIVARHVGDLEFDGDLYTMAGWYLDDFALRDGGWRIVARRYVNIWTQGNSQVLTGWQQSEGGGAESSATPAAGR